jgi:two-component system response regulator FixJ
LVQLGDRTAADGLRSYSSEQFIRTRWQFFRRIRSMNVEATVFIVDDDPAVVRLITELAGAIGLRAQSWPSANAFLAAYTPTGPGCLVLDVRMPGISGLQLQKELNQQGATLPIILITGHADVRMAVEAMKAGALEFFEKPFRTQDLCDKIQEAVKLDQEKWRRRKERENAENRIGSLTQAERQVMELVVDGKTNREIAAELDLSLRAVEDRRARLMKKLQAKSRAELLRLLRQSALR